MLSLQTARVGLTARNPENWEEDEKDFRPYHQLEDTWTINMDDGLLRIHGRTKHELPAWELLGKCSWVTLEEGDIISVILCEERSTVSNIK